jgi:hypothetical protein
MTSTEHTVATHICWHEAREAGWRACGGHDHHELLLYGRCRSGRRWFWAAERVTGLAGAPHGHGWANSEPGAYEAAREAVERLADGRLAVAYLRQGIASRYLKEINAMRRKARPPSDERDTRCIEHVYGTELWWPDGGGEIRRVVPFRVARKTGKRIYYIRCEARSRSDEPVIGFVDRQAMERQGWVTRRSAGLLEKDCTLFAGREAAEKWLGLNDPGSPDLRALRKAMADAHPDRGGTSAEFIAARKRYEYALRRAS